MDKPIENSFKQAVLSLPSTHIKRNLFITILVVVALLIFSAIFTIFIHAGTTLTIIKNKDNLAAPLLTTLYITEDMEWDVKLNGKAQGGTKKAGFKWTSSNTNVATIKDPGYMTAKAKGQTTITVIYKYGTKKSQVLTVKQQVTSVTMSKQTIPLFVGSGTNLAAIPITGIKIKEDINGNNIEDIKERTLYIDGINRESINLEAEILPDIATHKEVSWSASIPTAVSIQTSGVNNKFSKITARENTENIVITAEDYKGEKKATIIVNVRTKISNIKAELSSQSGLIKDENTGEPLYIEPVDKAESLSGQKRIIEGTTKNFDIDIFPINAYNKILKTKTSNENIITVNFNQIINRLSLYGVIFAYELPENDIDTIISVLATDGSNTQSQIGVYVVPSIC